MMRTMKAKLVEYLLEQATWREEKAAEYPEDQRNAASARALQAAASDVDSRTEDDLRLVQLDTLQRAYRMDVFSPGEDSRRLIARFGFDSDGGSVNGLLDSVIELEVKASTENVDDEIRWYGLAEGES